MPNMETNVTIEGKGRTKRDAFSDAFSKIQKELAGKTSGTIIRIEPLEVNIVEGKEYVFIEKFMFFFLKREVSRFEIKLEVTVRYFVIDDENFTFDKINLKNKFYSTLS